MDVVTKAYAVMESVWSVRVARFRSDADTLYAMGPSFTEFMDGVWNRLIPEHFPLPAERIRLVGTPEYVELANLRDHLRAEQPRRPKEPLITITIRIHAPLHRVLLREAEDRGLSLNQWCVRLLMQSAM